MRESTPAPVPQEQRRQEAGDEDGTPGAGGRRAARGRLREGDALARLAAAESSRAARVERNNFKCSLCHRVRSHGARFAWVAGAQ